MAHTDDGRDDEKDDGHALISKLWYSSFCAALFVFLCVFFSSVRSKVTTQLNQVTCGDSTRATPARAGS